MRRSTGKATNLNSPSSVRAATQTAARVLSFEDLRKVSPKDVREAYIPELGGKVYYRPTSAQVGIAFMHDNLTDLEQIDAMCLYVASTLCSAEGDDVITTDQVKVLSTSRIESIIEAIAKARKSAKGAKTGKGSRR